MTAIGPKRTKVLRLCARNARPNFVQFWQDRTLIRSAKYSATVKKVKKMAAS